MQAPAPPPPTNAVGQTQNDAAAMLEQIKQPLLAHFFGTDTGGHTFAHFIVTGGTNADPTMPGRQAYLQMKAAGKDALTGLLKTNVDIWSQVGGLQPQLQKFLEEFMHYDEIMAQMDSEEDDDEEGDDIEGSATGSGPGLKTRAN